MLWPLVSTGLELAAGEAVEVLLVVGAWLQPLKARRVAVVAAMDNERNADIIAV